MDKRIITVCAIILAAIVLSTASLSRLTDTAHGQAAGSGKESLSAADRRFAVETAHSNMAEVELGRLAVERAASNEVKQFAQRMIDDHTRANAELTALASGKGLSLSTEPGAQGAPGSGAGASSGRTPGAAMPQSGTPMGTSQGNASRNNSSAGAASRPQDADAAKKSQEFMTLKNKLSGLSGAEFDREYMRQMVKDHSDAVSMFERQSNRGNDAELKGWAAKTLPALREHLQMARDISAKTGGK